VRWRGFTRGRGALVVLAGIGIYVAVTSDQIHAGLMRIVVASSDVLATRPRWGAVLFLVLSAASAMLAFVSTSVIVPVALVTWGHRGTFLLLWLGWILGGVCAYWLSRLLGRRIMRSTVSPETLAFGDALSTRAPFHLVLLFNLALPSEVPGYALGLIRYDFRKYVAAMAIAEVPYAIATIYLGDSFLQRRAFAAIAVGAVIVGLSIWALVALHKRLTPQVRRDG
jgi:uncharacterized membrane protein YdjX (TVP38/TMEM64 family)